MEKNKVFIIAEAGVNHNGDMEVAKNMIDVAAEAGVDVVKFQTFQSEKLVSKNAIKADYQMKATQKDESQLEMLKKLELTPAMHEELMEYCNKKKIMFLSTPFDLASIDLLNHYGMEIFKVPSGEITNYPFLKKIGSLGKNVIISTGMCNIEEVQEAVQVLRSNGAKTISILHCNTEYPTPMKDVNLSAMITLQNEFQNCTIGYSDHTNGIEVAIAAVAMGAQIIEKHFTLDKNMEGPDHKASLEPAELKQMVLAIRNIEQALGTGIKVPTSSETKNIAIARKSIVAGSKICKGAVFTEENLTTKRPGTGVNPMRWNEVLGQKAIRDFEEDEMIEL